MSALPQLPSLSAEFDALRRRLDVLERSPRKGARDEPLPMAPVDWPGGSTWRALAQIGIGGLNHPVIRADLRATVAGAGTVELRLCDADTGRATSAVLTLTAGQSWCRVDWRHTLDPPHSRTGTWRRVLVQARVTSGTPTLAAVLGLASGVSLSTAPAATPAGTWSTPSAPAGY
ncbi:hypothetical protein [Kitasatospora sp. NPDC094011]|uniref:hypothetical protein n=1 Tax=Kitasatospora sp. NPDC094011 TaxID=3364090 RepID=UPI00380839A1